MHILRCYLLIKCLYNSYHEGFKKWVEVGNSGMFRPEMLRPMGLPEDVQVIAWGLSLERWEQTLRKPQSLLTVK